MGIIKIENPTFSFGKPRLADFRPAGLRADNRA
jgi:hypothetical protein